MNYLTIPAYSNLEIIRSTQQIIEGYYYGVKRITDYAILKGAGSFPDIFSNYKVYPYWLQNETDDYTNHDDLYYGISPAQAITEGSDRYAYSEDKTVGTRVMIDYETITEYGQIVKKIINRNVGLIGIYEYGNYPQTLVSDQEHAKLNLLYYKGLLKKTGRTYSYNVGSVESSFSVEEETEYEYDNQRYVLAKRTNDDAIFSNGKKLINDYYWVKVEPIRWYVNHNGKIAITEKTLIGGVPYNIKPINGITSTYLGRFISEVFSKDFNQFVPKKKIKISKDAIKGVKKTRRNPKDLDLEFGKIFDAVLKEEKKENKGIKVKVKVREKINKDVKKLKE